MSMIQTKAEAGRIQIRAPLAEDGSLIWKLVADSGNLDVNSAYCYMLLCEYFRDTCLVAEEDGTIVGFVSAFLRPDRRDTLFVWQIAVAGAHRGRGIARTLLHKLVNGKACRSVRTVEATVSPSNTASRRLFASLAETLACAHTVTKGFPSSFFPQEHSHEEEPLIRVGPIPARNYWRGA